MPADVIPADSLVKILTDIQLIESAIYIRQNEGKDVRIFSKYYYDYLYKKYKTDKSRIKSSIDFYEKNPEQFEDIYKVVLDSLGKKQSELNNRRDTSVSRPQ